MRNNNPRRRRLSLRYLLDHIYVCEECKGSGRVVYEWYSTTYDKDMKVPQPCPTCEGKGIISWHDDYE